MRIATTRIFSITVFIFFGLSAYAQFDLDSLYENDVDFKEHFDDLRSTYSIFDKSEPLNVTLRSDFKNIIKKKSKRESQEATIEVLIEDTLLVTRNLKIQPRGANRLSTCYYPPLKLNFKKSDMLIDQFREFDKIKLVGTCKGSDLHEQYLLNEYLIYKVYQILEPDYSFRVRLLNITYIDTSGKMKPRISTSFLLESIKEVAKRNEAVEIESMGLNFDHVERLRADVMAVFQYMMGNTDWSLPGLHNMKVVKPLDPQSPLGIAVPYDFDYCGIINASYAVPSDKLGITSVRERLYRGFCGNEGDIEKAIEIIKQKENEILKVYEDATFLTERERKQALSYLNKFFEMVRTENGADRNLVQNCR